MESEIKPIAEVIPSSNAERYDRLNKYLLYLLTGELMYFIVLFVGAAITVISVLVQSKIPIPNFIENVALIVIIVFMIAFFANVAGGLASLLLNIRLDVKGYPGTGHLLNWIFLACTSWIFLLAIAVLSQSGRRLFQ